jgi:peptidoglycan/xylan/chitin deacetylase (PgdA/CDA1 family)
MIFRILLIALLLGFTYATTVSAAPPVQKSVDSNPGVPVLLYHRFGPTAADSMTVTTKVFESHLKYLKDNGYTVIPLRQLVNFHLKKGPQPPPKSVVIVEDDAHKSVYSDMLPLVKKYNVPVTVFVYPSAISNAKYAMTWEQLRTLKKTGLFDFQSHTFWHPNFKQERKKLKPADFEKFVAIQLGKSKARLEKELGGNIDLLAWPFGIYDDHLMNKAAASGYRAAFTIDRRHVASGDAAMKLPRYLLIDSDREIAFARILKGTAPKRNVVF